MASCRGFNPATSLLAGMDTGALTIQLATLQQSYLDLVNGTRAEVISYTQGDGAKAVTYTRANISALVQAIRLLQAQLGIIERPRRALRVTF